MLFRSDGDRFIIRKKDAPNAGQSIPMGTPVTENDASARVPNGTQGQLEQSFGQEQREKQETSATNFADRVLELVRTALSRRSGNKAFIDIGPVSDAVATRIKEDTGLDVSGYTHSLDESGVRHIFNQHGDEETEQERGQVAVTEEDFARLREVVAEPDSIRPGNDANTVIFAKKFGNTWHYVQEVRTGRKKLAAKTLWKTRSAQLETGAPAVAPTSGTLRDRKSVV